MPTRVRWWSLLALLVLAAPVAGDQLYSVADLGTLGNPNGSGASALNGAGDAVGYAFVAGSTYLHAVVNHRGPSHPLSERTTIPCTELPELATASPLIQEWNTYRHEVQRLLAEGHEGEFVLIKGDAIIGFYETWDSPRTEGLNRFLLDPFLVHQIQS